MDINNPSGEADVSSDVASQPQAGTTLQTADQDHLKNLKGEFNRKFSKINEKLDAVLNAFSTRSQTAVQQPVEETVAVEPDVKQYVESVVTQEKQRTAWQEALDLFPELNPDSENFDERFYKMVDVEFSSNQRKDPRGPLKAAKLAALELGKVEALTKANIFKDEARRSRILSEGSSTPRESKKEKDPTQHFNSGALSKRLGINPDKLAKRIKENKDKYEGL